MKTRNNVQKAIAKSLAVIISLVLISITVNAQDFWRTVLENNSFSQIAMAMADNTEVSSASVDAYSYNDVEFYAEYTAETEKTLDIENWMINENNFFATVSVETEIEKSLELENWMTDETLFDGTAAYFAEETEEVLTIENWMQNTTHFGIKTINIETEADESLELEAWMTDSNTWK